MDDSAWTVPCSSGHHGYRAFLLRPHSARYAAGFVVDLYRGRLDQYGQRNRLSNGLAAGTHVCCEAWAAPTLCRRHDCDDACPPGFRSDPRFLVSEPLAGSCRLGRSAGLYRRRCDGLDPLQGRSLAQLDGDRRLWRRRRLRHAPHGFVDPCDAGKTAATTRGQSPGCCSRR